MNRPSHFDTHPCTARRARPALRPRRHPVGLAIASAGLVKMKLAPPVAANNFSAVFSFKGRSVYKPAYPESRNGQRRVARLTTHSPTLQACVGLDAHLHAFVGAQSCMAGVCTGPALGLVDVSASRPLRGINRNNGGLPRAGDRTWGLKGYFNALDGNITGRLNIPSLDAVSKSGAGPASTQLQTYGRDSLLSLAANVYGLKIGPLYDSGPVNAGKIAIPLYQNSFSFAMGAISGLPFNISQALPDRLSAERGYRAIFSLGSQDESGLEAGQIRALDLDCEVVRTCRSVSYANADPSTQNQYGERVFMPDSDALRLATNNLGEVGTDASQPAALCAAGYSPQRIELISPIGVPSPIPEPTSWAMLLIGLAGCAGVCRRKTLLEQRRPA